MGWMEPITVSSETPLPGASAPAPDEIRAKQAERALACTTAKLNSVKAKYDAAQTTAENRNHWAQADGLSAKTANSPQVRATIRSRARYEMANNTYCAGMLLTLANDMVGTGPRLQVTHKSRETAAKLERDFGAWMRATSLPQKLRTMRMSRGCDGEAFAVLTTNPRLHTPVQLDFQLVEADRVTTPFLDAADPLAVDGIRFDRHGNPVEYDVLPHHPGDAAGYGDRYEPDATPAEQVIHWFRKDRPGQVRGLSEIVSALPLYANLRRYTLAVIAAAETAAFYSGILSTPANAAAEDDVALPPFQEIELSYRMLLTMPGGYQLNQMKAEQPTTTYQMFKHEIINEIARCLNMPYNVAAGNSAGYNYSSGRLDHQIYFRSIGIDQADCEREVLDRLFYAWLDEANMIPGYLPEDIGPFADLEYNWAWDPAEDLDPNKSSAARSEDLAAGVTSFQIESGKQGRDWELVQQQQAEALGITVDQLRSLLMLKMYGSLPPAAATPDEAGLAPAETASVQDTAMNGAQIASLLQIVTSIFEAGLPVETARRMIGASFPFLDEAAIDGIIAPLVGLEAQPASVAQQEAASSGGAMSGLSRRQFKNNDKAIRDVQDQLAAGDISEAVAREKFNMLGVPANSAEVFVADALDGVVDEPADEGAPA